MNFKIYDDEFEENKPTYLEEINNLKKTAISSDKIEEWDKFVEKSLVDTRSYYILVFSLKVMKNMNNRNKLSSLSDKDFYNACLFKAMTFMPDKTFIETVIMIAEKFHKLGKNLAESQGVNVVELYEQAKSAKNNKS